CWKLVKWALCFLVALASARSVPYFPPLSHDMVNYINKLNTTWQAGHNFHSVDMSYVNSCLGCCEFSGLYGHVPEAFSPDISGTWPYSLENSQQPSDSGHESLRQHSVLFKADVNAAIGHLG
uniref:Peptidase C1A propeptide domain-containing protein n=1 Tax=Anolis carolinensis TaxID=28377 RepID=A0A803TJU4_ANOCA